MATGIATGIALASYSVRGARRRSSLSPVCGSYVSCGYALPNTMILTVCSIGVIAGLVCVMSAYKKQIKFKLEEWKYDLRVQDIGFWAILDDNINKKRNKLTEVPDVTGKIAVVTGGARGIGFHVAKKLTELGMTVVLGVRKVEAGRKIAKEFKDLGLTGSVDAYQLDTSSVKSVESFARAVAKEYPSIDLLVNNAGIMFGDHSVTVDGFESQLATNYLGHFLLTHLLLPNLKAAGTSDSCSRVVNVSSCAHKASEIFFDDINFEKQYFSSGAYSQSKLAQVFTFPITAYSLTLYKTPVSETYLYHILYNLLKKGIQNIHKSEVVHV